VPGRREVEEWVKGLWDGTQWTLDHGPVVDVDCRRLAGRQAGYYREINDVPLQDTLFECWVELEDGRSNVDLVGVDESGGLVDYQFDG
jgi:hypothetical protein